MTARLLILAMALCASACKDTMLTSPTEQASRDVNTVSSLLVPGGSAGRELELTAAGRIGVTLTATTPAGIVLGVGIGIPRGNSSCALATAVEAAAGAAAQVSVAVETGRYCVKVYDPGTLTDSVPFTISISRP